MFVGDDVTPTPCGAGSVHHMSAELTKLRRLGKTRYLAVPFKILNELQWRDGDQIAVRLVEQKLIIERVPLEKLAILRLAPVEGSR